MLVTLVTVNNVEYKILFGPQGLPPLGYVTRTATQGAELLLAWQLTSRLRSTGEVLLTSVGHDDGVLERRFFREWSRSQVSSTMKGSRNWDHGSVTTTRTQIGFNDLSKRAHAAEKEKDVNNRQDSVEAD